MIFNNLNREHIESQLSVFLKESLKPSASVEAVVLIQMPCSVCLVYNGRMGVLDSHSHDPTHGALTAVRSLASTWHCLLWESTSMATWNDTTVYRAEQWAANFAFCRAECKDSLPSICGLHTTLIIRKDKWKSATLAINLKSYNLILFTWPCTALPPSSVAFRSTTRSNAYSPSSSYRIQLRSKLNLGLQLSATESTGIKLQPKISASTEYGEEDGWDRRKRQREETKPSSCLRKDKLSQAPWHWAVPVPQNHP